MRNNKSGTSNVFTLWRLRLKSMVRYRLLFLTSAPILLTLLALVGITFYWSTHYTWQNALVNVSEKLSVADNSIQILQERQFQSVKSLSNSYPFQVRLMSVYRDALELEEWVGSQKNKYQLDFLRWVPIDKATNHQLLAQKASFFEVFNTEQMNEYDDDLAVRAEIPLLNGNGVESRGLISRSVLPVRDEDQHVLGYLDGGLLLNNSTGLVDQIRDLIYAKPTELQPQIGTVTLFMDDLRISTNVPLDSQAHKGRAIGTTVSLQVKQAVLERGENWIDRAYVYDDWYITAYQPIYNQYNDVIGMLYTGYLIWPLIKIYITNLGEISLTILALLLISGMIVYRGSRDLFHPIERIHHVVKSVQAGRDKRIGQLGLDDEHELTQLARQFDNMLDLLAQRNAEIRQAADQLEGKVQNRTAKLREKTEQLELHIQLLNQTRDKLVVNEKLAALGELTAGIAHEINNPTAVILGNVELLKFALGDKADSIEEEIQTILDQIDRIRNITRSLLQYSRQGGVQDEVTWQHVNPIVEESLTLVKTGAKKRDVQFVTELNAKSVVEVNRHHLLQILVNLEMNAIHAMSGEGVLTIRTEDWMDDDEESKGAIVHVVDQGCGIPDEQIKRIFDPFYTTKRDGTGLGLSVSQSILSQTGGEIKVTSKVGLGSQFSIYLPLKSNAVDLVVMN